LVNYNSYSQEAVDRLKYYYSINNFNKVIDTFYENEDSIYSNKNKYELFGNIGLSYLFLGNYDSSYYYIKKSLANSSSINSISYADNLKNLGIYYSYVDKPKESLEIFDSVEYLYYKNKVEEERIIRLYINKADVYRFNYFDYLNAEKFYLRALSLFIDKQDHQLLANLYYSLATTYRLKGDPDNAINLAYKAAGIYQDNSVTYYDLALCFNLIANSYVQLNNSGLAIKYYKKVLNAIGENTEYSNLKHMVYNNMAIAFFRDQSIDSAQYFLDKAISQYNSVDSLEYNILISNQIKGEIFTYLGDFDAANQTLLRLSNLSKQKYEENHTLVYYSYFYIGKLLQAQNRHHEALKMYNNILEGMQFSDSLNSDSFSIEEIDSYLLFQVLRNISEIYSELFELSRDPICFSKYIEYVRILSDLIVESNLNIKNAYSLSLNFELLKENAELALNVLYRNKNIIKEEQYELANWLINSTKSFSLFLSRRKSHSIRSSNIPDSVFINWNSLTSRKHYLRSQLSNIDNVDNIRTELYDIKLKEDSLNEIFLSYSEMSYTKLDLESCKWIDDNTLILNYINAEEFYYYVSQSNDKYNLIRISKDSIEKKLDFVIDFISNPLENPNKEDFYSYVKYAYDLKNMLLPNNIDKQKIVVIPDGRLTYLSFDVLINTYNTNSEVNNFKDLDYIVKHYTISYDFLLDCQHEFGKTINIENSLVIGNPSLPNSIKEINTITKYLKGSIINNKKSAVSYNKLDLNDYDLIHLASHGLTDYDNPLKSKIEIASDNSEIEYLYAYQVYEMIGNNKFVVLNTCESGAGKNIEGEGIFSFSRAFHTVGLAGVIHNNWSVNDYFANKIMVFFYENINLNVPDALRKAKIGYLEESDKITSHPYYWAGHLYYGDSLLKLSFTKSNSFKAVYLLIIFLLIFLVFIIKKILSTK
jgi:CHAT domain-containing protein/tetratricopeptide (TPR) repeat protein